MACFAEFRGEDEVALKYVRVLAEYVPHSPTLFHIRHYQDAYSNLQIMFGSTAILPPRTKRWAEAKVLADCISAKVLFMIDPKNALVTVFLDLQIVLV